MDKHKIKVIFCGFPFLLDDKTNELSGFWTFLIPILSLASDEDGFVFMQYKGSYWNALKLWLKT